MLEVIKLELSLWKPSKWLPDLGGGVHRLLQKGECHQRPVFFFFFLQTQPSDTYQTGGQPAPPGPWPLAPWLSCTNNHSDLRGTWSHSKQGTMAFYQAATRPPALSLPQRKYFTPQTPLPHAST